MDVIQFGTEGWRGRIADDFTFAGVAQATRALCLHLTRSGANRRLVIGHDARFLSREFARLAADTAEEAGFEVLLSPGPVPTPAVSWAVRRFEATAGIVLTASHNPATYNGFKIKGAMGGPASPEEVRAIEACLAEVSAEPPPPGRPTLLDWLADYLSHLGGLVDLERILRARATVVVDPMHGAGCGVFPRLIPFAQEIHGHFDPLFGGRHPEPLAVHLADLIQTVAHAPTGLALGLAFDGDADRIGAVAAGGAFLNAHQIMALLLEHLVTHKGWSGGVVKTFSTSEIIGRLANQYHLPLHETPIGFKHISRLMCDEDVLIGGEESGGIGVKNHLPERDGLLMGLLLLEMLITGGQDLLERFQAIETRVGLTHAYGRLDWPTQAPPLERLKHGLPRQVGGLELVRVEDRDGLKLHFEDHSWLLVRASGTEPLLRLYAEGRTASQVEAWLDWGRQWVAQIQEEG